METTDILLMLDKDIFTACAYPQGRNLFTSKVGASSPQDTESVVSSLHQIELNPRLFPFPPRRTSRVRYSAFCPFTVCFIALNRARLDRTKVLSGSSAL